MGASSSTLQVAVTDQVALVKVSGRASFNCSVEFKTLVYELRARGYRKFILDLYRAEATTGNAWLHGVKSGRMVHIGAVDSPVTIADVKAISRPSGERSGP